jgi:anaerobic dimethyl sulfoxide reductase subunit A
MTANIGIPGGNSGVSNGATGRCGINLSLRGRTRPGRVASSLLADLLDRGRAGGYPADIKMMYSVAGDLFNQLPNVGKTVAAADKLEFIVVQDHFITPTARYADIVLPATTFWERNDVHTPWSGGGHYVFFMNKAVSRRGSAATIIDICADLAAPARHPGLQRQVRRGVAARAHRRHHRRLRHVRERGLARLPAPEDAVAFAREIRDPERHPFTTPSGKIEIYATRLAEIRTSAASDRSRRFPRGSRTPRTRGIRYGCSRRSPRARTHSIHGNQTTLRRRRPRRRVAASGRRDSARNPRRPAGRGLQRPRRHHHARAGDRPHRAGRGRD